VISGDRIEEACSSEKFAREDFNTIDLKELRFSDYSYPDDIECGPLPIRLKDGQDTLRCVLKQTIPEGKKISTAMPTYSTNLYIKLSYGYTFTISKSFIISKIIIQ
jgi:hypothetical protein